MIQWNCFRTFLIQTDLLLLSSALLVCRPLSQSMWMRRFESSESMRVKIGYHAIQRSNRINSIPRSSADTNFVEGVFETVQDTRKRLVANRFIEELQENINSNAPLSQRDFQKYTSDIDNRIINMQKKEIRLKQVLRELTNEKNRKIYTNNNKDTSKLDDLLLAKKRVEEKLKTVQEFEMLYSKQKSLLLSWNSKKVMPRNKMSIFQFFRNGNGDDASTMKLEDALEESTTSLVDGVFETVQDYRTKANNQRYTQVLQDIIQSGVVISAQEEQRRTKELEYQILITKEKLKKLKLAIKELSKEEASTKDLLRKEVLSLARQRVDEKLSRIQEQCDSYEKQMQLVLIAAGKASIDSLSSDTSSSSSYFAPSKVFATMSQFFQKSNYSDPVDDNNDNNNSNNNTMTKLLSGTLKNVQSVPQLLFSTLSSRKTTTLTNETDVQGRFNPLSGAQNLLLTLWEKRALVQEEWIVAFPKSEIDPGQVKPICVAGLDLLVVASRDQSKLYCIANSCSHLGTPLETGMMERRLVLPTERAKTAGAAEVEKVDETNGSERDFQDCIICPLHRTAFSLETGDVIGEWCPYPPLLGAMMGNVKAKSAVAVFDIRTRGKNIEIKLNSQLNSIEFKE